MGRILKLLVAALENFSSKRSCFRLVQLKLTPDRRDGGCSYWRSQRVEFEFASHGEDGSLLSLG